MLETYPAVYRDRLGEERTVIQNDGKSLRMVVRGIEFVGDEPMSLRPTVDPADPRLVEQFELVERPSISLSHCTIAYEVPLPMIVHGKDILAILRIQVSLGLDRMGCSYQDGHLRMTLSVEGRQYEGQGESLYFDEPLSEILSALPEDICMKACINCAFSWYSPYGGGGFGDMMCLRDCKEAVRAAKHKGDMMAVMSRYTEKVQETYLCPDFEPRARGTTPHGAPGLNPEGKGRQITESRRLKPRLARRKVRLRGLRKFRMSQADSVQFFGAAPIAWA